MEVKNPLFNDDPTPSKIQYPQEQEEPGQEWNHLDKNEQHREQNNDKII